MEITDAQIDRFRELYIQHSGIDLSVEDAKKMLIDLVEFIDLFIEPF